MKATFKEFRHLSADSLRALCIVKNWYTGGNNDEYNHLLIDLAEHKENLTTEDIITIAEDIFEHSGRLDDYEVESIAWEVNRACNVSFERQ